MKSELLLGNLNSTLAVSCVFAVAVAIGMATPTQAGITATFHATVTPPPSDIKPGTVEPTSPDPIVFLELANGLVPAGGIPVDHDGSDVYANAVILGNNVSPPLDATSIPAGTRVNSYVFQFDPAAAGGTYLASQIEFAEPIIGVQMISSAKTPLFAFPHVPYTGTLEFGDAAITAMGGPGPTYYPVGLADRGLEGDQLIIDDNRHRIAFFGDESGAEIDQVRIFTAVPEPCSMALLTMVWIGLVLSVRARSAA
jgi:hypothetical protein